MTSGYAGKILRLDLTKRSDSTIDTGQYEQFGGDMGSAQPSSGTCVKIRP